jgi:hypothetical protein
MPLLKGHNICTLANEMRANGKVITRKQRHVFFNEFTLIRVHIILISSFVKFITDLILIVIQITHLGLTITELGLGHMLFGLINVYSGSSQI